MKLLSDFADLESLYGDKGSGLRWPYVFSLPGWMDAWWRSFGAGYEPLILYLRKEGQLVGIAPLKRQGETASFIGDASVCDYLDFVVASGREPAFAQALLDELAARGIDALELATLRPDSVAWRYVVPVARASGFMVECRETDVSYELALPDSFEAYLGGLDAKQRHELERKQRNMAREGPASFRVLRDGEVTARDLALLFGMMAGSRADKAGFLTEDMKTFFQDMAQAVAGYGALRLGLLEMGTRPVAAVLCFDYNDGVYLYNSGYDPSYARLSAGLISKLEAVRWAIQQKKRVFDFLKGAEVYKERLGGMRLSLSSCRFSLA